VAVAGQTWSPAIGGCQAGRERKGEGRRAAVVWEGVELQGVKQDDRVLPKREERERSS
jgi:hypothetical protein